MYAYIAKPIMPFAL